VIPRHIQITIALLLVGVFASGIYILRLHRRTQENLRRAAEARPVDAPVAGTPQEITLAIAYDDDGAFRDKTVSAVLPSEASARAREILETLIAQYVSLPSPHPLGPGSAVNNVFVVNRNLAVVDLNQAMADEHRSGIMVEDFTLLSLIETLSQNMPEIKQVKILVNGRERETLAGHADLSDAYSTAVVHQMVEQLQ
jgi:hypothetical protein